MSKILLVTREERKDIAKRLSMKIEGSNTPIKIINISELAEEVVEERRKNRKSMIIEIVPILIKNNKDTNRGITHVKDAQFNVVYGIHTSLDHYKNIVYARILLENGITLNLDNIEDAKKWVVLRMHPLVQGSPLERDPIFRVNDPSIEAEKVMVNVNKTERLFDQIRKMNGKEIVDSMRYLGENVDETLTFEIAKSRLLEKAIKLPESTYDKLANKQRGLESKVLAAVEYDIIQNHSDQGYTYDNIPLGISMQDVLNHLENDKTVKASVLTQVAETDVVSDNIQAEYELLGTKKEDTKKIF